MDKMNWFDYLTFTLVIIGALNWGLVGLFNFDLVSTVFGDMTLVSRVIYIIVGLSAVYMSLGIFYVMSKNLNKKNKE